MKDSDSRTIRLRGVSTHNLRGVDVDFPHHRVSAVTGVSGSGKSSLAFDTLYAECQRRFLESLSPYLRQFMDKWSQPAMDSAGGLLPAMAVRQRKAVKNSRSTVGTLTEVADHLRLLFVRAGTPHCPECGVELAVYAPVEVVAWCLDRLAGREVTVLFAYRGARPRHEPLGRTIARMGYPRVFQGGRVMRAEELPERAAQTQVVVDRVRVLPDEADRLLEAVRAAGQEERAECRLMVSAADAAGIAWPANVAVEPAGEWVQASFPARPRCSRCGQERPAVTESLLSSNTPEGACPTCKGFGDVVFYDPARYLDPSRTLAENPVVPWQGKAYRGYHRYLLEVARRVGWPLDVPFGDLPAEVRDAVQRGGGVFPGVEGFFRRLERKTYRLHVRVFLSRLRSYGRCPDCGGKRLNPRALSVRLAGRDLGDVLALRVSEARYALSTLVLPPDRLAALERVLEELAARLQCLEELGLGYLTLDRPAFTLSGGEMQRVHLAAVLGTGLADTLFILDEPTLGLHPRDHARLGRMLRRLCDARNTVVFVEHDPGFIARADHAVELGPRAGRDGGRVLYQGAMADYLREASTATTAMLRGDGPDRTRPLREAGPPWLEVSGARARNLKSVRVRFPVGRLSCVTGVSGSGKSTLLEEVVLPAVEAKRTGEALPPSLAAVRGAEAFRFARYVDQGLPPGSSRSMPATFLGIWDSVRRLFAAEPEARAHGVTPGYFSLNVEGGRCEWCKGRGRTVMEMQFLADEEILCDRCGGTGYSPEARAYTCRGLTIVQALDLTAGEAAERFGDAADAAFRRRLDMLRDVGLGYLRLGQPLSTLSGGEAQRLKLCRALLEPAKGQGLFLLDEPTTGLHPTDTATLLRVLDRLLDDGHTVIAVEHDLHFLENADWVVDLGPEGGPDGGWALYQGPVDGLTECASSHTGRELAGWRKRGARSQE